MQSLNIPVGISDFEQIRRNGYYYVDKSGMILEILKREPAAVTLITRPRRFGKTLGMSMLASFFDIRKDSRELFEGLEISGESALCGKWMNQYPVIFLSLRNVSGRTFADALAFFSYRIVRLFGHHSEILSSDKISARDRMLFEDIINQSATEAGLRNSLKILTRILTEYYQKQPIVLVDDYDAPDGRFFAGLSFCRAQKQLGQPEVWYYHRQVAHPSAKRSEQSRRR